MGKSNTLKKTMMGVYLLLSDIGEPGTKNKIGGGGSGGGVGGNKDNSNMS